MTHSAHCLGRLDDIIADDLGSQLTAGDLATAEQRQAFELRVAERIETALSIDGLCYCHEED